MTEQEAIKILSKDTSMEAVNELTYYAGFNRDKVIEQIQEAMTMGANALEKQNAKRPIHVRYKHHITRRMVHFIYCGVCGPYQQRVSMGDKYCRECGTKIDWTVDE